MAGMRNSGQGSKSGRTSIRGSGAGSWAPEHAGRKLGQQWADGARQRVAGWGRTGPDSGGNRLGTDGGQTTGGRLGTDEGQTTGGRLGTDEG